MTDRPLKDETLLAHAGNKPQANFGIVNPPVYHASTILFPTVAALEEMTKDKIGNITYGRFGTPTTFALEEAVALPRGRRSRDRHALGPGRRRRLAVELPQDRRSFADDRQRLWPRPLALRHDPQGAGDRDHLLRSR
jgi:Cystathionine beta-lyases/cystathionine gamma-synthases